MINRLHAIGITVMVMCLTLGGFVRAADEAVEKKSDATKKDATASSPARKVAIFVKNRAKSVPDDKVSVLEDLIAARITDLGFSIISREDVLNSVGAFADAGPNVADKNDPGAKLDAILSSNTSALKLAQNLNATYIMYPSITTFGFDRAKYKGDKVQTDIIEYKMRLTCKLTNANDGGTETGDAITVSKRFLQNDQLQVESDVVNDLLDEASVALAEVLKKKVDEKKIPEVAAAPDLVPFTVICGMTDLSIPEIVKDEKGEYVVSANKYQINAMAVTVAVDGVVAGTTEGSALYARPGLSKLRLTREGFKPVVETINIRKNGIYNFSMQMDGPGYARFRENSQFLNELKAGAKLSDAQVKQMEGMAKMLEQSGFRVDARSTSDTKSDVKTNTTQPTQFQQWFNR